MNDLYCRLLNWLGFNALVSWRDHEICGSAMHQVVVCWPTTLVCWFLTWTKEVQSTSKAKGAVVYLISNSRLSETCFNLLKKQKITKKKITKKRWKYRNLCQWRSPFIPKGLCKMQPQGGDRIHTGTCECLLCFFHNLVFHAAHWCFSALDGKDLL